jgi:hypothetical protein
MSMITHIMLISNHFSNSNFVCDFFFIKFSNENALLKFFQKIAHMYNKETHKLSCHDLNESTLNFTFNNNTKKLHYVNNQYYVMV